MDGMQNTTTLKTTTLNGKHIAYSSDTEFLVQVGRHSKGSYRTRLSFRGDLAAAVFYFNAINVGMGYKKRLLMPTSPKPVLCRQFSSSY